MIVLCCVAVNDNKCNGVAALFCICNNFEILGRVYVTDLGSEYGNQPYRSFREQTDTSHRPVHRAEPWRACQHPHQFAGANASHDFCSSSPACPGLLLWWRSGRWDVAVCSGKDCSCCGTDAASCVLRRRSGRRNLAVCSGQDFFYRNADPAGVVLRWRSGRRHLAVCPGQNAARALSDRVAESAGVLRRRSGRRHLAVCSLDGRHPEPVTLAGRLSNRGGGQ